MGVAGLCLISFVAGVVLQRLYDRRGVVSEGPPPADRLRGVEVPAGTG
jgi:hypothetical protein